MRRRHRIHGNPFSIRGRITAPQWHACFERAAPLAVDVGFGRGGFVLELARRHPEWNVVGLEIRDHLVESLLEEAKRLRITNLFAIIANATLHFKELFRPNSVAFVSVNFPDPWFKKRHHKRRVVQAEWLEHVADCLVVDGEFHAKSDYQPIAEEMLMILNNHSRFENMEIGGGFAAESTTGITTEREVSHSKRGQPIYRLHFRRCAQDKSVPRSEKTP